MPFQNLCDGLYLLKRPSNGKPGMDHYGILDVGNRLGHPQVFLDHPVMIEMTPPRLKFSYFQGPEVWTNLGRIPDEAAAIGRMRSAAQNPDYDWFLNNCEHFARSVATGERVSTQIQAGVAAAGLAAIVLAAVLPEKPKRRRRG